MSKCIAAPTTRVDDFEILLEDYFVTQHAHHLKVFLRISFSQQLEELNSADLHYLTELLAASRSGVW